MKRIDLKRSEIDKDKFKKRTALKSDVSTLIKEDCIIYVDDVPVVLYKKLQTDTSALRWAVKSQKYNSGKRSRGLVSTSNIFGFSPRVAMRHDYCTVTSMAQNYPKQHHVITDFAKELVGYYREYFPNQYEYHNKLVEERVMNDWTIGGSPFTSGIVNKNNQLKYHFDAGNFKGVLSNMVVFKKDVEGGHLIIPELDIALEVADNTLTVFNGQEILHGVSTIEYQNPAAYRYSIVYYSLEQMWKCEPLGEEIKRIRKVKTEREKKRLDPEHMALLEKRRQELKSASDQELIKNKVKNADKN
jgi:hypothetical protein